MNKSHEDVQRGGGAERPRERGAPVVRTRQRQTRAARKKKPQKAKTPRANTSHTTLRNASRRPDREPGKATACIALHRPIRPRTGTNRTKDDKQGGEKRRAGRKTEHGHCRKDRETDQGKGTKKRPEKPGGKEEEGRRMKRRQTLTNSPPGKRKGGKNGKRKREQQRGKETQTLSRTTTPTPKNVEQRRRKKKGKRKRTKPENKGRK